MSHERRPNETIQQYAIRRAWELGHFWNPSLPEGQNVKQADLARLNVSDQIVIDAFRSLAMSDATCYAKHVFAAHGRPPVYDGQLGPAMTGMITDPVGRCPVPDYAPPPGVVFAFDDPALQVVVEQMQHRATLPALGVGNWKSCHSVGNAHCVTVRVNPQGLPTFLRPLFERVLARVQKAYADVGLLILFCDMNKVDLLTGKEYGHNINIEMSFVGSSDGWIGLAIVGTGETCGGNIWCRFLNTYRGGQNDDQIITQWTTLIKHELGHNTGCGHMNGGVMNPSIVTGLPPEWSSGDPATAWMRKQFSGVPVVIPGSNPTPGPTPTPPEESLQKQVDDLRVKVITHEIGFNYLAAEVLKLKGAK